ncbi:MAG: glycosyltransferase [Bryobacteraceae bacterium]|nr:glycosyltransferase [Bryobacteraceae bacterium]
MDVTVPRIVLLSVGRGQLAREYGGFVRGLHRAVSGELDATLLEGEAGLPLYRGFRLLAEALPYGGLEIEGAYNRYKRDALAFGLSVLPRLYRQRYDIIHYVDPPLAMVLEKFVRRAGIGSRLVYSELSGIAPPFYPKISHVHQVSPATMYEAEIMAVPPASMTMIPCAVEAPRGPAAAARRSAARQASGISESAFVVLVNGELGRIGRRVHYVIDEVSQLEGEVVLWLNGPVADPAIPEMARQKLGSRCRISDVGEGAVQDLYGAADVMVHAVVQEPFGIRVAEAMCHGVPVLVQRSSHMAWLTECEEYQVEMRVPGNLAARLGEQRQARERFASRAAERAEGVRARFDWTRLKGEYAALYRRLLNGAEAARPADAGEPVLAGGARQGNA